MFVFLRQIVIKIFTQNEIFHLSRYWNFQKMQIAEKLNFQNFEA